jgi:hypothetical protein
MTFAVVAVGVWLPFSLIAELLGFASLPVEYFGFVASSRRRNSPRWKRRMFRAAGEKGGFDGRRNA